jgi:hypothetical protein
MTLLPSLLCGRLNLSPATRGFCTEEKDRLQSPSLSFYTSVIYQFGSFRSREVGFTSLRTKIYFLSLLHFQMYYHSICLLYPMDQQGREYASSNSLALFLIDGWFSLYLHLSQYTCAIMLGNHRQRSDIFGHVRGWLWYIYITLLKRRDEERTMDAEISATKNGMIQAYYWVRTFPWSGRDEKKREWKWGGESWEAKTERDINGVRD